MAHKQKIRQIFNTKLTKDPSKIFSVSGNAHQSIQYRSEDIIEELESAKRLGEASHSGFRGKLKTLLLMFNDYAKPIDIMVQHQPHVTALVWGSLRALMHACFLPTLRNSHTAKLSYLDSY